MPLQEQINHFWKECESISLVDKYFGRFVFQQAKKPSFELFLAAILTSYRMNQGDVCIDLSKVANQSYALFFEGMTGYFPSYEFWRTKLLESEVVSVADRFAPLVFEEPYLYLYRYWYYEKELAKELTPRIFERGHLKYPEKLQETLNRYFPVDTRETDWQKMATVSALLKKFCLISGSPGTGKTTTVIKILAVLIEHLSTPPRIQIAAPTGKAAARLQEAILSSKQSLNCSETIKSLIPEKVSTIHRLLEYVPARHQFIHQSNNPLPADILVVDEASMIDLALMAQLVSALKAETRFILIGDQNQLTSVEAGWVFGNLCEAREEQGYSADFIQQLQYFSPVPLTLPLGTETFPTLSDCIVLLSKNFRFKENSGIRYLSHCVLEGKKEEAQTVLQQNIYEDIQWFQLSESEETLTSAYTYLQEQILEGFRSYLSLPEKDVSAIFKAFSQFRLLCALVKTEAGTENMNLFVEHLLQEANLIRKKEGSPWYRGRPVMIMHNDYALQLFNGDVGIALEDVHSSRGLKVYFPDVQGNYRAYLPERLPHHETAFAMTVHKSQGSEFDKIVFVFPFQSSPILSRELLYTAITRAKQAVCILGKQSLFEQAIQHRENRVSGLKAKLLKKEFE